MLATWNAVETLDRLFDDVMGSAFGTATNVRSFEPAIDVRSSDDAVVLVCDVPGVRREDLDIVLDGRELTISGRREFERNGSEQVALGRPYGRFRRSFTLADALDPDSLSAELADGVLTVRIQKHAKARPRRIPIVGVSEAKQLEGRSDA
jgi:HSP20 family protein